MSMIADSQNANPQSFKRAIIVLGMHRSGTSALTRVLNLCGAALPKKLLPPKRDNQQGFWESFKIMTIHDEMLASAGSSWYDFSEFPQSWFGSAVAAEFKQRMLDALNEEFADSSLFILKDPRICRLIPFWLEVLKEFGAEPGFVISIRHPLEVASSLKQRDGFEPAKSLLLWLQHFLAAERDTREYRRSFVTYKKLLLDWQGVIFRIETDLKISLPRQSHAVGAEIEDFLQLDLRHHHEKLTDLSIRPDIVTWVAEAFDWAKRASSGDTVSSKELDNTYHAFLEADKAYGPIIASHHLKQANFSKELQARDNKVADLAEMLQVKTKTEEILKEELQQSQAQVQASQAELQRSHYQLEQLQSKSEAWRSELEAISAELDRSHYQQEQLHSKSETWEPEFETIRAEFERSQSRIKQLQAQLDHSHATFAAIESSFFWKLRRVWVLIKRLFGVIENSSTSQDSPSEVNNLPSISKTQKVHQTLVKSINKIDSKINKALLPVKALPGAPKSDDPKYQAWLNKNYPKPSDLRRMTESVETLAYRPSISIITPVYNTPEKYLRDAIDSVLDQVYPHWELCLADDASTKPDVREILNEYAARDARIKLVFRQENGHISHSSNSALEVATGEFVALLDHDDLLTPDALYEVVQLLNQHPEADMIYSDEDKINSKNQLQDPFFKPDWCPDSFLSRMYTAHIGVYRRFLVNQVSGFRPGYEGAQDYDLVLRLTEQTQQIFHIPRVLYHWRIHPDSTAQALANKGYATQAARQAITEGLERRGESGAQVLDAPGGHFIVRYQIKDPKLVSIIIPTRDLGGTLNHCLTSIFDKSTYNNYEVIVIDNGSTEAETMRVIDYWATQEPQRFRCYPLDIPFNFSKINNYGVTQARGDYLLFLNNDIEVITPDWIEAMVEQAQRPAIGAVGALLLYPDNTIQHAGVIVGIGGVAGHSHKYFNFDSSGYFNQIQTINNYSAVTAACLMCRREIFEAVGGFEETIAVAFNDVDLCLKIHSLGYKNIYLPHVKLYHHESKSRGYEDNPEKQVRFAKEVDYMQRKWIKVINKDPCYSSNLTLNNEDYSIL